MCEDGGRHELFETARQRAGCTITQLWVGYLSLGGKLDQFTIEAYLHGLTPLPPAEQDVLATAVNERLADLYRGATVPYLNTIQQLDEPRYEDPLDILEKLLPPARTTRSSERTAPQPPQPGPAPTEPS
jgi:hypothetical protein